MATYPPRLRPLTVAEIVDAAFRLYRRHFGRFVAIAAVVYVPVGFVEAAVAAALLASAGRLATSGQELPANFIAGVGVPAVAIAVVAGIGYLLAYAAMAVAVSREYLGHEISVAAAYSQVWPAVGALVGAWLLVTILVGMGFILCVIPGIYLAIALIFAVPVVVLEGLGAGAAIGRSMELVRGYWFHVFVTMLLLGLIVGIIQVGILWPVTFLITATLGTAFPVAANALTQLISALASMVLFPLTMAGLVIIYYDLRVRKEGFDLQLLAEQIGGKLGLPPSFPVETLPPPAAPGTAGEPEPPPLPGEEAGREGDAKWDDDEPRF
ncbi:MAG: glycerophosphoryl diester phosphodiesterase membrane domain-containing protein [Armatimonadetes bacterium]|nr:glycerophosphoryl diester phosphodiesterase membrane domain-containing protein [Armatimonadota bacterium]